jgi:hypothetical protein
LIDVVMYGNCARIDVKERVNRSYVQTGEKSVSTLEKSIVISVS